MKEARQRSLPRLFFTFYLDRPQGFCLQTSRILEFSHCISLFQLTIYLVNWMNIKNRNPKGWINFSSVILSYLIWEHFQLLPHFSDVLT